LALVTSRGSTVGMSNNRSIVGDEEILMLKRRLEETEKAMKMIFEQVG
jgi:hypothetical protein